MIVVRIASDVDSQLEGAAGGAFAELIRLQTEFQARLAEETLRYLRRLQGAVGPSVPGTVVLADATLQLNATGSPGQSVELRLEVERTASVSIASSHRRCRRSSTMQAQRGSLPPSPPRRLCC